jgi:N-acetylmuramoyl-L-alanine amidase CwlA
MKISQKKITKIQCYIQKTKESKKKKKFENRELTDESFNVWKLDGDDSGETLTIKHR